jgi:hypothetical protein
MGQIHSQRKRGRSVTDLISPSPVERDGDGPWDKGLDTENKPPVRFRSYCTYLGSTLTRHLQSKRAKIQVESVAPPSVESDGGGAQDQVIDPGNGERLTRTMAHGSAVELGHVPIQLNNMRMRKDYPWVTVRDHVDCLLTVSHLLSLCHG